MGFRFNHTKFGPFRLNLSSAKAIRDGKGPLSSVSLDLGIPVMRLWSRNGQRGLSSIDTPGQGSIRMPLAARRNATRRQTARRPAVADPGHAPLVYDPRLD